MILNYSEAFLDFPCVWLDDWMISFNVGNFNDVQNDPPFLVGAYFCLLTATVIPKWLSLITFCFHRPSFPNSHCGTYIRLLLPHCHLFYLGWFTPIFAIQNTEYPIVLALPFHFIRRKKKTLYAYETDHQTAVATWEYLKLFWQQVADDCRQITCRCDAASMGNLTFPLSFLVDFAIRGPKGNY